MQSILFVGLVLPGCILCRWPWQGKHMFGIERINTNNNRMIISDSWQKGVMPAVAILLFRRLC